MLVVVLVVLGEHGMGVGPVLGRRIATTFAPVASPPPSELAEIAENVDQVGLAPAGGPTDRTSHRVRWGLSNVP
jgi:hypothetical protein